MKRALFPRIAVLSTAIMMGLFAWMAEVNLSRLNSAGGENSIIGIQRADAFFGNAWEEAKKAAGNVAKWFGTKATQVATFVHNGVKWTASKIKQVATDLYNKGKTFLAQQLKAAWEALKRFDCSGVVTALAPIASPLTAALASLVPGGFGTTCHNNLLAGFICGIPDAIVAIGKMLIGIGQAAWDNKKTCLATGIVMAPVFGFMGPLAPTAGILMCGAFYYFKNSITNFIQNIKNAISCFKAMSTKDLIKLIFDQAVGTVCNFIGGIAFDIVLAVLTAGSGAVASVAKWVTKVKDFLTKLNPMEYLKKIGVPKLKNLLKITENSADKVYDLATGFFKDQFTTLAECGGSVNNPTSTNSPSNIPMVKIVWKAVYFRSGPSMNDTPYRVVYLGDSVRFYQRVGTVYCKVDHNGLVGYIACNALSSIPNVVVTAPVNKAPVADGWYAISSKKSGLCLDVKWASKDDRANIWQWACNNGAGQTWYFKHVGNGFYTLKNKNSSKYLDVEWGSAQKMANVWQYTYNGGAAQTWKVTEVKSGYYSLTAKHSGMALDVEWGSTKQQANIWQYTYDGNDAQLWKLTKK